MLFKKYFAELLGTFFLTFMVSLSLLGNLPLSTPVLAALTVGLFVYTVGPLSGAHFNPAVTLGMLTVNKISFKDTIGYIIFQLLGAYGAYYLVMRLAGSGPVLTADNLWITGVAEAIGAFVLTFGIAAVLHKKVQATASGLVVGGSLLLGLHLAAGFSNAIINPAVAVGLASVSWMYMLGPVVGGIVGASVFAALSKK